MHIQKLTVWTAVHHKSDVHGRRPPATGNTRTTFIGFLRLTVILYQAEYPPVLWYVHLESGIKLFLVLKMSQLYPCCVCVCFFPFLSPSLPLFLTPSLLISFFFPQHGGGGGAPRPYGYTWENDKPLEGARQRFLPRTPNRRALDAQDYDKGHRYMLKQLKCKSPLSKQPKKKSTKEC